MILFMLKWPMLNRVSSEYVMPTQAFKMWLYNCQQPKKSGNTIAICLSFWYSPRLVFIISFWSNPIGLCSLAYICASIGILWCSTMIGFGSYYFRVIHYPSLYCHRTSFDPPSFIRRRYTTPEFCYSRSPS